MVNAEQQTQQLMLTLIVPQSLADTCADLLMQIPVVQGFTQDAVLGFSRRPSAMSTAEQVAGRQANSRFQLLLSEHEAQMVLANIAQQPLSGRLHYVMSAVLAHGHCSPLEVL
jgi:hypothetical protein